MFNFKEVRNRYYGFKPVSMSLVWSVRLSKPGSCPLFPAALQVIVALEGKSRTAGFPLTPPWCACCILKPFQFQSRPCLPSFPCAGKVTATFAVHHGGTLTCCGYGIKTPNVCRGSPCPMYGIVPFQGLCSWDSE